MAKRTGTSRTIFHIDVNSAFLSWSAVKRLQEDPAAVDLRTIPSAVGGDVKARHGIITAKSIPAKKYGIQTGEPVVKALQKCPELVLIPSDFAVYREFSRAFIEILRSYSEILEQVSIDEAYLDVTELVTAGHAVDAGSVSEKEAPERVRALQLAQAIRDEIRTTLGFTVNVGISNVKILAKMASDFRKPDLTHTLYPEEIEEKLWPLPIRELHGCGARTAEKLGLIGILTIGDAARADEALLQSYLGQKAGEYIYRSANGIGSDIVHAEHERAKSYSNETTTAEDITADNYDARTPTILRELSEHVARRLARDGARGTTITVSVKTSQFQRRSRQTALSQATSDGDLIFRTATKLLSQLCLESGLLPEGGGVRLIGVGVSGLDDAQYRQETLFDWMREEDLAESEKRKRNSRRKKDQQLREMLDGIRERYGEDSIRRGV